MPAPFAALQVQLDAEVLAHLANAEATLPGGSVVNVLFDDAPESLFDGLGNTPGVRLVFPQATAGLQSGVIVVIGGASYRLRQPMSGDGPRQREERSNAWSAVKT
jgi:hypothetical protein